MRAALAILLVFAACAREHRQPPKQELKKIVMESLADQKAEYNLKWSINQGENILATTQTRAKTDHGIFHFLMQKQAVNEGRQVAHRLEVFRTKKDLFTGVDGSRPMRWSSFVHEDRDLWAMAFGDLGLVLHAFRSCYFMMDGRVKMTAGTCKPDFDAPGISANELKALWTKAGKKGFEIKGSRAKNGLWTSLDIKISLDDMSLDISLSGKPLDKVAIDPPKKWISDKRQRPWAMLQELKRAIK